MDPQDGVVQTARVVTLQRARPRIIEIQSRRTHPPRGLPPIKEEYRYQETAEPLQTNDSVSLERIEYSEYKPWFRDEDEHPKCDTQGDDAASKSGHADDEADNEKQQFHGGRLSFRTLFKKNRLEPRDQESEKPSRGLLKKSGVPNFDQQDSEKPLRSPFKKSTQFDLAQDAEKPFRSLFKETSAPNSDQSPEKSARGLLGKNFSQLDLHQNAAEKPYRRLFKRSSQSDLSQKSEKPARGLLNNFSQLNLHRIPESPLRDPSKKTSHTNFSQGAAQDLGQDDNQLKPKGLRRVQSLLGLD